MKVPLSENSMRRSYRKYSILTCFGTIPSIGHIFESIVNHILNYLPHLLRYISSMSVLFSVHLPWFFGIEEDQWSHFQFFLQSVGRFKQVQWILCTSFNELEGTIMSTFPIKEGISPMGPLIYVAPTNGSDHLLNLVSLWKEKHKCL